MVPRVTRNEILAQYNLFPFEHHPFWRGVLNGSWSLAQIIRAEGQHFIRSNIGRLFRERAMKEAKSVSQTAYALLYETYKEECTDDETGPSHVDLIRRLLMIGGMNKSAIDALKSTPGNIAAIALYKDITDRGPLHHMIGAGAVEYYYSELSPKIFEAYTQRYGMTEEQAFTYKIHGPMDKEHAERALSIIDEPSVKENSESILSAVKDAFTATSLHYDGMLQAATGTNEYWSGR